MAKDNIYFFNNKPAYNGAITAVAAVFGYSIIVLIYVIIRSSATIYSIMPPGQRNTILWVNGLSVAYSVAVFSLLMAGVSSVAGALAALVLNKALLYFNPRSNFNKSIYISGTVAISLLLIMYFILHALLKEYMTFHYTETFLFWFLFPAVIFLGVCIIGGCQLSKVSGKGIK